MKRKTFLRNGTKTALTLLVLIGLVGAPALAAELTENSVRSKHIVNGQVKNKDLAQGAVTLDKMGFAAVGRDQLVPDSVTSSRVLDGTLTATDLYPIQLRTNSITVNADSAGIVTATCNNSETAVNAGAFWDGAPTLGPVYVASVHLAGTGGAHGGPNSATAAGRNDGSNSRTLFAQVACIATFPVD
jgi:hypothetical protein